jgi:hypothetical protein
MHNDSRQYGFSIGAVFLGFLIICILFIGGVSAGLGLYIIDIFIMGIIFPIVAVILLSEQCLKRIVLNLGWIVIIILCLWPRYSYLRFGGLPALTPSRGVLVLWITFWISFWIKSRAYRQYFFEKAASAKWVYGLLILLVGWIFFANLFSSFPLRGLYITLDHILMLCGFFFMLSATLMRPTDVRKLINIISIVVLVIVAVGIAELVLKRNVFAGYLPVTEDYAATALSDKIRDSGYRVQSTFDHPLSFSQFLVAIIPMLIAGFFSAYRFKGRLFYLCCTTVAIAGLIIARSRSGIVISTVTVLLFMAIVGLRRMLMGKISISDLLITIGMTILLSISIYVVSDKLIELTVGRTSAEMSSSNARLVMLRRAIPLVLDSPLIGHGSGRAAELVGIYGRGGALTVDSLLISYAVESGLVAFLAYISLIVAAIFRAIRVSTRDDIFSYYGAGLAASLFGFFLTTITLSLTPNLFVLATLLAATVALGESKEGVER